MLYWEIWGIVKNTYFEEHLQYKGSKVQRDDRIYPIIPKWFSIRDLNLIAYGNYSKYTLHIKLAEAYSEPC